MRLSTLFTLFLIFVVLVSLHLGTVWKEQGAPLDEVINRAEDAMSVNESAFNIREVNGTEDAAGALEKYAGNMVNHAAVGFLEAAFSIMKYSIVQGYDYDGEIDFGSMVRLIAIMIIVYAGFMPALIISFLIVYGVRRIIRNKEGLKE